MTIRCPNCDAALIHIGPLECREKVGCGICGHSWTPSDVKPFASSVPHKTADARPAVTEGAGSGNTPGIVEERARQFPLDSANHYRVVGRGDGQIGVYALPIKNMSPAQAVNLAAWLITIADPEEKEFRRVRAEILK